MPGIPIVHTPQECPIAIRPLVDKKLDKVLEQEVIVPVMEPIDWVSSLAYSWKADGDLRICLNPTHLNTAVRQDHYRTPMLEEITHELASSTKFTKVDGSWKRNGFLCLWTEHLKTGIYKFSFCTHIKDLKSDLVISLPMLYVHLPNVHRQSKIKTCFIF